DITGKLGFVETPAKRREPALEDGGVDVVVATCTFNDTRKQQVDVAGPYYIAGQDIMVRKDASGLTGVTDLNGRPGCWAPRAPARTTRSRRRTPTATGSAPSRAPSAAPASQPPRRRRSTATERAVAPAAHALTASRPAPRDRRPRLPRRLPPRPARDRGADAA